MSNRSSRKRQAAILKSLQQQGRASVAQLAREQNVSEVTIRKDLSDMEDRGLLLRRHGGAVLVSAQLEPVETTVVKTGDASRIGLAAAALISDNSRIVVDSGLTTAQLVPHLRQKNGLVVMSNSLRVIHPLTEWPGGPTILMPGGTWDRKTQSFQGQMSEQILRAYDFDQLFVGADGIDLERGTTTFNELINLSRVMADVSRQVIVMAESNKVARKIPNLELAWSQIDVFVTDDKLSQTNRQIITELGVEVILA